MPVLGISCFYHDSAAVLLNENGQILFAAQEERFTRIKHDPSWPKNAIKACLDASNLRLSNISKFIFYEFPLKKFDRITNSYLNLNELNSDVFTNTFPKWMTSKINQHQIIKKGLLDLRKQYGHINHKDLENKIYFTDHHLSHASSAFYPSPYNEALILITDGVGEHASTSLFVGRENEVSLFKKIDYPNSLGLLYSAFTYYCGFKVNSGEYKLMGLAPFGSPTFTKKIKDHFINLNVDGSYTINPIPFDYFAGKYILNEKSFINIFNKERRKPSDKILKFHCDLASSIQSVLEDAIFNILRSAKKDTNQKNLCLAGGVALNCVVNGKIRRSKIFQNIWVQPAAGDAGGALGAAFIGIKSDVFKRKKLRNKQNTDFMYGSLLGPSYSKKEIYDSLKFHRLKFELLKADELLKKVAFLISTGSVIGWFQGRMEFGPRALGNRSILADPRSSKIQKDLNLRIKKRESFRPFAPSILFEKSKDFFDIDGESPYMSFVESVTPSLRTTTQNKLSGVERINETRSVIPGVTHVDYSARIQTVHKEINPKFYSLLSAFFRITSCPILINTSFNIRGEPIVCSPDDAINCFMSTEIDALAIGNYLVIKKQQDPINLLSYETFFEDD